MESNTVLISLCFIVIDYKASTLINNDKDSVEFEQEMKGRIAVLTALVMARNKKNGDKMKSLLDFSEDFEDEQESDWGYTAITQAPMISLLNKFVKVDDPTLF